MTYILTYINSDRPNQRDAYASKNPSKVLKFSSFNNEQAGDAGRGGDPHSAALRPAGGLQRAGDGATRRQSGGSLQLLQQKVQP